jgi:hypothetical protein
MLDVKPSRAIACARAALAAGVAAVNLIGPPGVGKSDIARQVAAAMAPADLIADPVALADAAASLGAKGDMVATWSTAAGIPLKDLRANLLDPVDLRGLPKVEGDRTRWLPPDFLPMVDRDGPVGILFIDELPTAAPAVQSALFGLILDRFIGDYRLPPGWVIMTAGNRTADRAGAQRMPTALANRMCHLSIVVDHDDWQAWANRNGLDPVVRAFLIARPGMLHQFDPKSDAVAFPTPRAWAQVAKVAGLPADIRYPLVAGLVGAAVASEFEAFARIRDRLPNPTTCLADPLGAPVPTDLSVMYALAAALARVVTVPTMGGLVDYAARMPAEFAQVAVREATDRNPALKETAAYARWAASHAAVAA